MPNPPSAPLSRTEWQRQQSISALAAAAQILTATVAYSNCETWSEFVAVFNANDGMVLSSVQVLLKELFRTFTSTRFLDEIKDEALVDFISLTKLKSRQNNTFLQLLFDSLIQKLQTSNRTSTILVLVNMAQININIRELEHPDEIGRSMNQALLRRSEIWRFPDLREDWFQQSLLLCSQLQVHAVWRDRFGEESRKQLLSALTSLRRVNRDWRVKFKARLVQHGLKRIGATSGIRFTPPSMRLTQRLAGALLAGHDVMTFMILWTVGQVEQLDREAASRVMLGCNRWKCTLIVLNKYATDLIESGLEQWTKFETELSSLLSLRQYRKKDKNLVQIGIIEILKCLALLVDDDQVRLKVVMKLIELSRFGAGFNRRVLRSSNPVSQALLNSLQSLLLDNNASAGASDNAMSLDEVRERWMSDGEIEQRVRDIQTTIKHPSSSLFHKITEAIGWITSEESMIKFRDALRRRAASAISFFTTFEDNLYPYTKHEFKCRGADSNNTTEIALQDLFQPTDSGRQINKVLMVGDGVLAAIVSPKKMVMLWCQNLLWTQVSSIYHLKISDFKQMDDTWSDVRKEKTLETIIANRCFDPVDEDEKFIALRGHVAAELRRDSALVILDTLASYSTGDIDNDFVQSVLSRSGFKMLLIERPSSRFFEAFNYDRKVACQVLKDQQIIDLIHIRFGGSQEQNLIEHLLKKECWDLLRLPENIDVAINIWRETRNGRRIAHPGLTLHSLLNKITSATWTRFANLDGNTTLERGPFFRGMKELSFKSVYAGTTSLSMEDIRIFVGELAEKMTEIGFLVHTDAEDAFKFLFVGYRDYFASQKIAKKLLKESADVARDAKLVIGRYKYSSGDLGIIGMVTAEAYRVKEMDGVKKVFSVLDEGPIEIACIHHCLLKLRLLNQLCEEFGRPEGYYLSWTEEQVRLVQVLKQIVYLPVDQLTSVSIKIWVAAELNDLVYLEKCFGSVTLEDESGSEGVSLFGIYQEAIEAESFLSKRSALLATPSLIERCPERLTEIIELFVQTCVDGEGEVKATGLASIPLILRIVQQREQIQVLADLFLREAMATDWNAINANPLVVADCINDLRPEMESEMSEVKSRLKKRYGDAVEKRVEIPSSIADALENWLQSRDFYSCHFLITRVSALIVTLDVDEQEVILRLHSKDEVMTWTVLPMVARLFWETMGFSSIMKVLSKRDKYIASLSRLLGEKTGPLWLFM